MEKQQQKQHMNQSGKSRFTLILTLVLIGSGGCLFECYGAPQLSIISSEVQQWTRFLDLGLGLFKMIYSWALHLHLQPKQNCRFASHYAADG